MKTLYWEENHSMTRNGETLYTLVDEHYIDIAHYVIKEHAERIATCVNRCAGITDEALHMGIIEYAITSLVKNKDTKFFGIKIWEDK